MIRYELLGAQHVSQVQQLLITSFFPEEPICVFRGLKIPEETAEMVEALVPRCAAGGASFVAVDDSQPTGAEVVGARLSSIERLAERDGDAEAAVEELAESADDTDNVRHIKRFLRFMNQGVDAFALHQTDTVLRMKALTTLVVKALEHAKDRFGAGAAVSEVTSKYTQRLYLGLGFQVHKEVAYDEYRVSGELVFPRNGSVHDSALLVSKAL